MAPKKNPRRYVNIDVSKVLADLKEKEESIKLATFDLQREAAFAGVEKMKQLIEIRGAQIYRSKPWGYYRKGIHRRTKMRAKQKPSIGSLRSESSPGRVNTGNMRDSVRALLQRGEKKTIATFGWTGASSDDQEYFRAQEHGFSAGGFRRRQKVTGMFALRDARLYVKEVVIPQLVRKYKNRIIKGKY